MSTQKKLSQLSFAVIALLVAALPALAQTGSNQNQRANATNWAETDRVAVLGHLSVNNPETMSVGAPVISEKQPSLSVEQFINAASQPVVVNHSGAAFDSTIVEDPKKSFNDETSSRKRITFVPSRGQKLPQ